MREQTINVPIKPLNEQVPPSGGPKGMLERLENGVVKKFDGDNLRVSKRPGSTSLSATTYADGSTITAPDDPKLISAWRDQLFMIGGTTPYARSEARDVWDRVDGVWGWFGLSRLAMETLARRPLYNAGSRAYAPDAAAVGNVLCYVIHDDIHGALVTLVDAASKTQIRDPFAPTGTAKAKVVSDGSQFWVFSQDTAKTNTFIQVFDTNGTVLATSTIAWGAARDNWDVGYQSTNGKVVLVTPTDPTLTVSYSSYAASVITTTTFTPASASQNAAYLMNAFGGTNIYVAVWTNVGDVVVYEISSAGVVLTSYNPVILGAAYVGQVAGMVMNGSFDVRIAIGILENNTSTPSVAAIDNKTLVYELTHSGGQNLLSTLRSIAPVSRPWADANGVYRLVAYYQSTGCASTATTGTGVTPDVSYLGAQPGFFVIDMSAANPGVVGHFENGTGYAFYATSRNSTVFAPWALASVVDDLGGTHHVPLGVLGKQTVFGNVSSLFGTPVAGFSSLSSIYDFVISRRSGTAIQTADSLLIPGLQAEAYDGTQVVEDGIQLAPEVVPTVTFDTVAGNLTPGEFYTWVFVYEWTDAAGNLYQSPASEPYQVTQPALQTRTLIPVATLRTSQKTGVRIAAYRTFSPTLSGTTTGTVLRRVGDIANSPGVDSVTFIDIASDAEAALGQPLYTQPLDTSAPVALDYFAPPPFSKGVTYDGRTFVIGYDGAIWFSFPKAQDQGVAWSPFFRIVLPTAATPVAIAALDARLAVFCDDGSVYTIASGGLPNATLTSGTIPTPERVSATAGATTAATLTPLGVIHGAASGVWLMDRGIQSRFIGGPVVDEVDVSVQVMDILVDSYQRVFFTLGTAGEPGTQSKVLVFDLISSTWAVWNMSEAVWYSTIWNGRFAYADAAAVVHVVDPDETTGYTDDGAAIISTYDLAAIDFAGVNGYESVWQVQFFGAWYGAHQVVIAIRFDEDPTVAETFTQDVPTDPGVYRYEFLPARCDLQQIALSFSDAFVGVGSPGNSFALEAIGFLVGIETGLGRLPPTTRRIAP